MNYEPALIKTLGFGVEDYIKKALLGGWKNHYFPPGKSVKEVIKKHLFWKEILCLILLEPSSWRAVGITEGWGKTTLRDDLDGKPYQQDTALRKQIEFIYSLWEATLSEEVKP